MSTSCSIQTGVVKKGAGLLNKALEKLSSLPIEFHIPGYNFCGPNTQLEKRLARGDKGINLLDEACKEHDIAYSQFKDVTNRNRADRILTSKAFERLKSFDSRLGEKLAALAVGGIMKAKSKFGMGLRKRRKSKKGGGIKRIKRKRVIPTPKLGGFLPLLLPILGALGALAGGGSAIAKTVIDAKNAKKAQQEMERHNKEMKMLANNPKGSGLFLRPYKSGSGLNLRKYKRMKALRLKKSSAKFAKTSIK